jgi:hypothetical protein
MIKTRRQPTDERALGAAVIPQANDRAEMTSSIPPFVVRNIQDRNARNLPEHSRPATHVPTERPATQSITDHSRGLYA